MLHFSGQRLVWICRRCFLNDNKCAEGTSIMHRSRAFLSWCVCVCVGGTTEIKNYVLNKWWRCCDGGAAALNALVWRGERSFDSRFPSRDEGSGNETLSCCAEETAGLPGEEDDLDDRTHTRFVHSHTPTELQQSSNLSVQLTPESRHLYIFLSLCMLLAYVKIPSATWILQLRSDFPVLLLCGV